jgi:hypothetical protein
MMETTPVFDSVQKALVFAFNAANSYYIASPTMNTMMAAVPVKPSRMAKRLKAAAGEAGEGEIKVRPSSPPPQPGDLLRGLNKAGQAGLILHEVAKLDAAHYWVLAARCTEPTLPCDCRSLCCQGWRTTPRWDIAINKLCHILANDADITKTPGKRGLSTEPRLRRMLVERFFLEPDVKPQSIASLARIVKVSPITAAKHDGWVTGYLVEQETEAWTQIQAIFDQTGITGTLE